MPVVTSAPVLSELVVPEHAILRSCVEEEWKGIELVRWIPPADRALLMDGYEALVVKMLEGEVPRPDPLGEALRREIFDLVRDPGETEDLSTTRPERVTWLERRCAYYLERCLREGLVSKDAARPAELPDPDALGDLQALGYL